MKVKVENQPIVNISNTSKISLDSTSLNIPYSKPPILFPSSMFVFSLFTPSLPSLPPSPFSSSNSPPFPSLSVPFQFPFLLTSYVSPFLCSPILFHHPALVSQFHPLPHYPPF